jgi:flagellin
MLSIQTNVNSLVAQQNLNVNTAFQSKTITQLTSGYRINQSGDDAAGLSVANKFRSQVAELTQGVANGNDGVAQLQIMDGGMNNISQILNRLKTLATQSASGTLTGGDATRQTLNGEFQTDLAEIDRQAQSIGLNTGGSFAKSLDVYLGQGSGSTGLANGIVTLNLAQSAVDTQALGMKGMQAVNLINIGTDSANSVQNIVSDTTGTWLNQQAVAGHAAFQFSGAGFSDAGKQAISVNLSGVTDVGTLVSAVNNAIQAAGQGNSAASTAFKNAGIVAKVNVDANGGQELAFSSSTAAFQVQAGDQMANALMGNFSAAGQSAGVAQGKAVTGTTASQVVSVPTTAGTFASGQAVKMVVTGGGLASPVTLQVNTSNPSGVQTGGAITDLENQFAGNAQLQAAGLTMTGSPVVGGKLTFDSATGQSFNIQVTGDKQNLLGLGSFLTDAAGNADYTSITSTAAYNAASATNNGGATASAVGLEVSVNGMGSLPAISVDLTAGPSATTAKTSSTSPVLASDIDATNNKLSITVVNNGVSTTGNITLNTNTELTSAAKASSSVSSAGTFSTVTILAANHNNQFSLSVDGGAAQTATIADGTYTTAASLLSAVQTAIGGVSGATASFDATSNMLTLSSTSTGSASSVSLAQVNSGALAGTLVSGGTFASTTVNAANHNNTFMVSVDGGTAHALTIADGTYSTAAAYQTAIQNAITADTANFAGRVTASFDAGNSNKLTLTSDTTGATSSVTLTAATYATNASRVSSGGSAVQGTSASVVVGTGNNTFNIAVDGGQTYTVTLATATYGTGGDFLAQVKSALAGTSGLSGVTAAFDATTGMVALTSTNGAPGAATSINLSQNGASTFLADFGFTAGTSRGSDSVNNALLANAGFAPGSSTGQTAVNTGLSGLGLGTGSLTRGTDDAPTSVQSIASQISTAMGTFANVSVASDGTLSIESLSKGANSSVTLNHVTSNSAYSGLHLSEGTATGQNESITDVVNDLNAQFASTALQAAGLTASATNSTNTGAGAFITISSANGNQTQFRLDSLGGGSTGTSGAVGSTMTQGSYTPITVTSGSNDSFKVAVDGGGAKTLTMATGTYATAGALLTAVQNAIQGSDVNGMVTAGWDSTTSALTFTSVNTGTGSTVTMSANGGNTGLTALGFTGTLTNTGTGSHTSAVEDIGFGAQGSTFVGAAPSSTGTTMSTQLAGGVSNSTAFDFSALKYGSDKQALTFSATDANGAIETKTITLQNNASANRAGVSIDDAVAYINTQLQASTDKPALQSIMAVKQANAGGAAEQINFVSKLTGFTVGVSATANGDGLNSGAATYRKSEVYGAAANITIDTQAGAKAAISAIGSAVSSLGVAQAAVGKGENQLSYAITLAQSQITNFSAAESQIRDANVAEQAANLSKAQVLQQSSIAAMAQANSAPQAVLSLLKG